MQSIKDIKLIQSIGCCDHGFALSLLSYCHYAKLFMTRPMMDTAY
jgi:hypothetical protein